MVDSIALPETGPGTGPGNGTGPSAASPRPEQAAAGDTDLPLRRSTDIQGDVLAGFRKDHVQVLLLAFGDPVRARRWLGRLRHRVATTRDVAAFNAAFSQARRNRGGDDPAGLAAVWRGVSFTHAGLSELIGGPALADVPRGSTQEAFVQGPARRAQLLGDTGPDAPEHWMFGAPHNPPVHAVLTVAADRLADLTVAVAREREEIAAHGLSVAFEQYAATLPGERRGKEHFGFKDAVSQPAVQDFDEPDPGRPEYARDKPGSRLIPPGEFVVGLPLDHRLPAWLPDWMAGGSFHVVRRLAQDVPGWWAQVADQLAHLKAQGAVPATAGTEWLAARFFGRWRSGTPVAKSPDTDRPLPPGHEPDNDVSFRDDPEGRITPLFSHMRKSHPRDGLKATADASEPLAEKGALDGRRLMRRGVPYGLPFDPAGGEGNGPDAPRGMLFVCYQSDLVAQFEFVQRTWIGGRDFPDRDTEVGPDAVLGGDGTVAFPAGGAEGTGTVPLTLRRFVRTEGSLYAFAPSLPALERLARGGVPIGGGPAQDRVLPGGTFLRRGEVVSSGRARLRYQDTGDLTVHDENERLLWSAGQAGSGAQRALFDEDGRLFLAAADQTPLWQTPTGGNPGAVLVVGADGDVSIRAADGRVLWHTDTAH